MYSYYVQYHHKLSLKKLLGLPFPTTWLCVSAFVLMPIEYEIQAAHRTVARVFNRRLYILKIYT